MKKRNFNQVFLETIPVIIGILIAVVISNIQQRYADRQYLKSTIKSIKAQNQENVGELKYALDRQATLLDTLNAYLLDDSQSLIKVISRGNGLYTPDLKSATWKFLFENENHTLVSYEIINQLSEIEKYETLIVGYNSSVRDIMFRTEVFKDPQMKNVVRMWLYGMIEAEMGMTEELQKFDSLTSHF